MIAALGTVLVVDDDAVLRSSLESVLGDLGYRVLSTGSPDVAYQLLGTEPALAVLLDVRLLTMRSEEHTSELQSQSNLVCRLLLEKKKKNKSTESMDRTVRHH